MDTFFEQIVSIKKSGKAIFAFIAIWILALLLCGLALFLFLAGFRSVFVILLSASLFGAYKLSSLLNVEYEYIMTNGTLDIDKIINKSSRKRIASFDLDIVSRVEKFNVGLLANVDSKNVVYACNANDPEAYLMVYQKDGKSPVYVVVSPNEKMKNAIVKFLPKFVANSAFK